MLWKMMLKVWSNVVKLLTGNMQLFNKIYFKFFFTYVIIYVNYVLVFRLSPFLYDLAHLNPENTKFVVQAIIKEKHKEFEKNKKKYPYLDTVCSTFN